MYKERTVIWRIQVDAETPREAAEEAEAILAEGRTGWAFEVYEKDPGVQPGAVEIDLMEAEDDD